MNSYLPVLGLAFVILCVYLTGLVRELSRQVAELSGKEERLSRMLADSIARIYRLEHAGTPVTTPVVTQVVTQLVTQAQPPPLPVTQPAHADTAEVPREFSTQVPIDLPSVVVPERQDWEAIIGGNWLNKLGVLILVVGIALFLGYGVTQLGPAGLVAIGLLIGASMLVAGVLVERKPDYTTYGRGLIAGGWAAIYFTAYAMHGLEAARVIQDPLVGAAILLGVSVAILFHSFRYRSEPATLLAYFVVFVSLNLSPLTSFSVTAALLLTCTLIVSAYRFSWSSLAAAGIIFTYATFALRYEPGVYAQPGLFNGQPILWIYWLAFEIYDLLNVDEKLPKVRLVSILNGLGFIGASLVHQFAVSSHDWGRFLTTAAIAYLASMAVRVRLLGDGRFAFTASAILFAAAIIESYSGLPMATLLAVEGEIIFLAGALRRDPYAKAFGSLVLALPFVHLYTVDIPKVEAITLFGHKTDAATPLAFVLAIVFYANRFLAGGGWYFATAASALAATVVQLEVATYWVAGVWAAMMAGAFWLGIQRNEHGLRIQSYLLGLAVFARVCVVNFDATSAIRIETTIVATVFLYGAMFLTRMLSAELESTPEGHARTLFSVLGTALLTMLIGLEVQGRLLTISLGGEGISLLICGFLLRERSFRLSGLAIFLFCICKIFLYDIRELDTLAKILSPILLGLLLLGASWVYTRFREQIRELL